MKVLITAAPFGNLPHAKSLELLHAAGLQYELNPFGRRIAEQELIQLIPDASILIAGTEPITAEAYEAELNRLHERREELEEQETTLTSHDHGGGLPHDQQNRLDKVRGELADLLQSIGDLQDRFAYAGGAPPERDGALGE